MGDRCDFREDPGLLSVDDEACFARLILGLSFWSQSAASFVSEGVEITNQSRNDGG